MGGSNDQGMEAAKRVNEWPGEAQMGEYSMIDGDFEFDHHFEGLNMADNITITRHTRCVRAGWLGTIRAWVLYNHSG